MEGLCRPLAVLLIVFNAGIVFAEDTFDERVRAYILENPEVILEALTILSERETRAAMLERIDGFPELFSDTPRLGEGDKAAPRRVVEFFDYKCVPCKAVHPRLVSFVEENPDVRVEMRHLPILTPSSEHATRFALATEALYGAETYEAVHSWLWDTSGPLNAAGFKRIAQGLSLDYEAISQAMDSQAIDARIEYNRNAAIVLEVFGTPAFITKESVIVGSTDIDALAEAWLNQ